MRSFDPKPTFKIGPMNGREARESGRWLIARVAAGQLASSSSSSKRVLRSRGFHKDVTEVLDHVEGAHPLGECGRRHPDPAISGGVDVKDKERVGLGVVGAER